MSGTSVRVSTVAWTTLAILAACGEDQRLVCADVTAPGVVIQFPGIDVAVRDAAGQGRALGTTVVVRRSGASADSAVTVGRDTVHVPTGFAGAGTFAVTVRRPFYRDTVVPNVAVVHGGCTLDVTEVPVTLRLAPGAPPVRSVGILGREFFPLAGDTGRLVAVVDADAGLSRAVTWRSADTTLARVDAAGIVTARCTTLGGTDTVTAVSVADTTVRGKAPVVVTKQTSCP